MNSMSERAHSLKLPDEAEGPFRAYLFKEHDLLLYEGDIPVFSSRDELFQIIPESALSYLGYIENCFAVTGIVSTDIAGFQTVELRSFLRDQSPLTDEATVYRASGIAKWRVIKNYCSVCGCKLRPAINEYAMQCPDCQALAFPRLNPAVITAVIRDGRILLAHNRKFRSGMYSLIAGFIEPGESPEEAVAREIWEEVGLKVRNIRYWRGQSWPFPNSLMLGFIADYAGEEINVDGEEIAAADWFAANNLPDIPSPPSISRAIIDAYIAGEL